MQVQEIISSLLRDYSTFLHSPIMQHYGMLAVGLIGLIPSFISFIPDESFLLPIYQSNPTATQFTNMFLTYGTAIFTSNMIMLLSAHHLTNILKKEKKHAVEAKHLLFKYRIPIFMLVPSLLFGIGDMIVIYSGIKHMNIAGIAPFLLIGSFIRAGWAMFIISHIPNLLGQNF